MSHINLHIRVSENRGTLFGGVSLRGFDSIWGITGVPLFWEMPIWSLLLTVVHFGILIMRRPSSLAYPKKSTLFSRTDHRIDTTE